jgi:imidazolonepropionase-like amidohydrolase
MRSKTLLLATLAVLALLILVSVTIGQQNASPSVYFIKAGRFFDSEQAALLPARDIIVRGNIIESVGEKLAVPAGATVIDLSRFTVMPGLIDSHTHLLYLENPRSDLTMEGLKALTVEGLALRALRGAARGKTFLMAGITTVRDLGNSGLFGDVALRTAIREGTVDGPRMAVSGPGLSPVGGQFPGLQHGHLKLAEAEYRIIRGVDDARAAVRENVTLGATVIKIYADNTPNPASLSFDEMKAIVDEAHLMGVKVAAHATGDASARRAVEAGVDSIEHGYEISDQTLTLMKEKGTRLVPTDIDSASMTRYLEFMGGPKPAGFSEMINARSDRLKRAVKAGVTIAAGSDNYIDFGMPQGVAAKKVLIAYKESGFDALEILKWATYNAGRLIDDRLGVIRPQALADIIALDGDPSKDFGACERVRFVMKNGKVYLDPGTVK